MFDAAFLHGSEHRTCRQPITGSASGDERPFVAQVQRIDIATPLEENTVTVRMAVTRDVDGLWRAQCVLDV